MGHSKSLNDIVDDAFDAAYKAGWWTTDQLQRARDGDPERLLALLALVHSEVSEALEDVRLGHLVTTRRSDGKPEGFPSELADIVIRVFDLAGALNINLEQEIINKMEYNATRGHRHGGKSI